MSELDKLKAALERLAGGTAGEGDRQTVQQALQAGRRAQRRLAAVVLGTLLLVAALAAAAAIFRFQSGQNAQLAQRNADAAATAQANADARAAAEALANKQRDEAQRQLRIARAGQLAAQAQIALEDFPERSLLLAVEALSATLRAGEPRLPRAESALREALAWIGSIPLVGHKGAITTLAFSPDGRTLAFSPDGRTLATGSGDDLFDGSVDNTARLWPIRQDDSLSLACATAGRNFTRAEWAQYIPWEPYRKTCPQWPLEGERAP